MDKFLFLLLGATGDLAQKKLLPALFRLFVRKEITNFHILGVALENITAQEIIQKSRPFMEDASNDDFDQFARNFSYCQVNVAEPQDFKSLAQCVQRHKPSDPFNIIVYCATPSSLFCSITEKLAHEKIIWKEKDGEPFCRVVYEKPFGHDAASAHEINTHIATYLNERQVYRVDHYLGKDIIGSIALLRFTNRIFEPLWNHHHIDWIKISLRESGGIGNRGRYYDKAGALNDVVQNHILQILALISMESPTMLQGNYIQDQKSSVLRHLKFVDGFFGQYEGYLQEPHIPPNSTTETFAALKLMINNKRWHNVPFYVTTGKCLEDRETKVVIRFKESECLLTRQCPSPPNTLTIQITPKASFSLAINVKKPGLALDVESVPMKFCYEHHFSPGAVSGYEAILEEVVRGEQSISVRFDEIEYAWAVIDEIKKKKLPLYRYKKGSSGPAELKQFMPQSYEN